MGRRPFAIFRVITPVKADIRERGTRRIPVPRDRYRATARRTGIQARLRPRIIVLDAVFALMGLLFALYAGPRMAGVVGGGVDELGAQFLQLFPSAQGTKAIDLPSGGANVTVSDPILQGLVDFTREPALTLSGRIPSFAFAEGRTVEIGLNGAVAATVTPDTTGAFGAALTLREGPNAIALTVLSGKDVVAHSSYTVVLDRQPPTITVTRPSTDATVDGPNITVEGKAEVGATVIVNDRTIVPAQDGSFTEFINAPPGALTITVLARDRAGNETAVKTPITVKAPATAAPISMSVILSKTKVAPGGFVTATIFIIANGIPQPGQQVTLSVGVITIGSAVTDSTGIARISFAAPPNEGDASVVVLAAGTSGRATLTVAK